MGLVFSSYEFSQCHLIQMLNQMPNQMIQIYQVIQHLIQHHKLKMCRMVPDCASATTLSKKWEKQGRVSA